MSRAGVRMRLPSVVPRDGIVLVRAIEVLRDLRSRLEDAKRPGLDALSIYQKWSNDAARRLPRFFETDDLERLVLTRRHLALQTIISSSIGDVRNMVQAEVEDRIRDFEQIIADFEQVERDWASVRVILVAPDTNAYLHQPRRFDAIDWGRISGSGLVRLVVPEITVRELDRQKTYGKNVPVVAGSQEKVPTRARHTVRSLRTFLADPNVANNISQGLEVEFLANSLDHQRLDDPDSEFLDRLLAMQRLIGQRIVVATGDIGMELMARVNGLTVLHL